MFIQIPGADPAYYDNRWLSIKDICTCALAPYVPQGHCLGSSPRKAAYAFAK